MAEIAIMAGAAPVLLPDDLTGEITEAQAWLLRVVSGIETGGDMDGLFTHDPMQDIEFLNTRLRQGLGNVGIPVPTIRGMSDDPLGNILDWHAFLKTLVTVH